jgi:hypothetical protein
LRSVLTTSRKLSYRGGGQRIGNINCDIKCDIKCDIIKAILAFLLYLYERKFLYCYTHVEEKAFFFTSFVSPGNAQFLQLPTTFLLPAGLGGRAGQRG